MCDQLRDNIILRVDSYKSGHWLLYPYLTTSMYSYLESRGGLYPSTVFFGLQYLLKRYFTQPVTMEDVLEAEAFFADRGEAFNKEGWVRVVEKLGGRLPIRIKAVAEGSVVPTHNILLSV